MKTAICGILAFQGDVGEHKKALDILGVKNLEVRYAEQIKEITHLIIPGGESTVISKFLNKTGLGTEIKNRTRDKKLSVFGTCAGAIILARKIISNEPMEGLGLIDATITRNAYGSQINSFEDTVYFEPKGKDINAVFIRAPKIIDCGKNVKILARHESTPILAQTNNILISTFHPEYLSPPVVHEYFIFSKNFNN